MSEIYDRAGNPITIDEWAAILKNNPKQRRVALTLTNSGYRVSTVWLGFDHGWGSGPPLIFESMTFATNEVDANDASNHPEWVPEDCERYSTEAEARDGHADMVAKYGGAKRELEDWDNK